MEREDVKMLDSKLSQGSIHVATNPFVLAFRKNKDIATYLDERQILERVAKTKSDCDIMINHIILNRIPISKNDILEHEMRMDELLDRHSFG